MSATSSFLAKSLSMMVSVKSVTANIMMVFSFLISRDSTVRILPFIVTSPIGPSIFSMAISSSSKLLPYTISGSLSYLRLKSPLRSDFFSNFFSNFFSGFLSVPAELLLELLSESVFASFFLFEALVASVLLSFIVPDAFSLPPTNIAPSSTATLTSSSPSSFAMANLVRATIFCTSCSICLSAF